jgi:hypothetical protein
MADIEHEVVAMIVDRIDRDLELDRHHEVVTGVHDDAVEVGDVDVRRAAVRHVAVRRVAVVDEVLEPLAEADGTTRPR